MARDEVSQSSFRTDSTIAALKELHAETHGKSGRLQRYDCVGLQNYLNQLCSKLPIYALRYEGEKLDNRIAV